jgi:hypothetical protein
MTLQLFFWGAMSGLTAAALFTEIALLAQNTKGTKWID